MSVEDNKRVVFRFLDKLCSQGYAVFGDLDLVTEDFTWWVQGVGTFSGPGMVEVTKGVSDLYAGPTTRNITGVTAEGDRVAVEYVGNMPLKDGGVYQNTYHNLFVVRGERIASGREYLDTAYAQKTLRWQPS